MVIALQIQPQLFWKVQSRASKAISSKNGLNVYTCLVSGLRKDDSTLRIDVGLLLEPSSLLEWPHNLHFWLPDLCNMHDGANVSGQVASQTKGMPELKAQGINHCPQVAPDLSIRNTHTTMFVVCGW